VTFVPAPVTRTPGTAPQIVVSSPTSVFEDRGSGHFPDDERESAA
jgi:hypothetical protein